MALLAISLSRRKTAARAIFNVIATDVAVYAIFMAASDVAAPGLTARSPHSWFVVSARTHANRAR